MHVLYGTVSCYCVHTGGAMPKMVRVNTQLTEQQHKELLKLQAATGTRLNWLVQQAIAQYLESRKREIPR